MQSLKFLAVLILHLNKYSIIIVFKCADCYLYNPIVLISATDFTLITFFKIKIVFE